jgi:hypothetical protein
VVFLNRYLRFFFNEKYFSYFCLIVCLSALYVFNVAGISEILLIKKSLVFFLGIYSFFFLVLDFKKISQSSQFIFIFALLSSFFIFYFERRYEILSDLLLIIVIVRVFETKISLNVQHLRYFFYFCLGCVFLNLYFHDSQTRFSLGGLDPNYSAFLLFLLFSFNLKVGGDFFGRCFLVLLTLTSLSRAYLLSMLMWLIGFKYNHILERFSRLLVLTPLFLLFLFSLWIVLNPIKFVLFHYFDILTGLAYRYLGDSARLINFVNNESDLKRYLANKKMIEFFLTNPRVFFLGFDLVTYEKTVFPYAPHNLLLLQILKSGFILGISVICYFFKKLHDYSDGNTALIFSSSVFFSFLGLELGSVYSIFFVFIIKLNHDRVIL